MIRHGKMPLPFGKHGRHAPIATADLARLIVAILENPEAYGGEIYPVYGPTEYTFPEIADVIGQTLGTHVVYEQISVDAFASALGQSENRFFKRHCEELMIDHDNNILSGTNDVVEKITGRPPMSMQEFVMQNIAAFREPANSGA